MSQQRKNGHLIDRAGDYIMAMREVLKEWEGRNTDRASLEQVQTYALISIAEHLMILTSEFCEAERPDDEWMADLRRPETT